MSMEGVGREHGEPELIDIVPNDVSGDKEPSVRVKSDPCLDLSRWNSENNESWHLCTTCVNLPFKPSSITRPSVFAKTSSSWRTRRGSSRLANCSKSPIFVLFGGGGVRWSQSKTHQKHIKLKKRRQRTWRDQRRIVIWE